MYSLRKIPLQNRSKATVSAVLEAGARLFLSIGYEKSSTNKIAELAGVSVGSLYEYFPGKEAIFAEIRRREDPRHFKLLTRVLRSTINDYALHAPERLADTVVAGELQGMLKQYLLA